MTEALQKVDVDSPHLVLSDKSLFITINNFSFSFVPESDIDKFQNPRYRPDKALFKITVQLFKEYSNMEWLTSG